MSLEFPFKHLATIITTLNIFGPMFDSSFKNYSDLHMFYAQVLKLLEVLLITVQAIHNMTFTNSCKFV